MSHPLATLISAAVDGRFPRQDGTWHRVRPWRAGVEAVLAFSGHAVLAVDDDVTDATLARVDGHGGAHHPQVLLDLAGPEGWIDCLDVLLARRGDPTHEPLVDRPDLARHPRVDFAEAVRDDVCVLGRRDRNDVSVATLSRGIGGLTEMSVELDPSCRGTGGSTGLILAALARARPGEVVVAAVAPGNAVSLRAFLRAGFAVLGSVQLLRPGRTAAG